MGLPVDAAPTRAGLGLDHHDPNCRGQSFHALERATKNGSSVDSAARLVRLGATARIMYVSMAMGSESPHQENNTLLNWV